MAKLHRVAYDGQEFHARSGQVLLDAALTSGVDLPHDCRAGRCGSCLTRVKAGITLGGETRQPGMVHACQARIFSDLKLEIEALPAVDRIAAKVTSLVEVAQDIVEITMEPARPLQMLPGQYCRFRFRGYPARAFSPTAKLSALDADGAIRLNVKRVRDGRVTQQLGRAITTGHAVTIEGPFGHAFLRPANAARLVLVGSGTGLRADLGGGCRGAAREPGASDRAGRRLAQAAQLYMAPALDLASSYANVEVRACVDQLEKPRGLLLPGDPIDHLPALLAGDVVYAAGAPALVDAVSDKAVAAGAEIHADPFAPDIPAPGWIDTAKAWLRAS